MQHLLVGINSGIKTWGILTHWFPSCIFQSCCDPVSSALGLKKKALSSSFVPTTSSYHTPFSTAAPIPTSFPPLQSTPPFSLFLLPQPLNHHQSFAPFYLSDPFCVSIPSCILISISFPDFLLFSRSFCLLIATVGQSAPSAPPGMMHNSEFQPLLYFQTLPSCVPSWWAPEWF